LPDTELQNTGNLILKEETWTRTDDMKCINSCCNAMPCAQDRSRILVMDNEQTSQKFITFQVILHLNHKLEWLWTGWLQFNSLNRDMPFFTSMLGSCPRVIWLHFKWILEVSVSKWKRVSAKFQQAGEWEVSTSGWVRSFNYTPTSTTTKHDVRLFTTTLLIMHHIPTHQLLVNLWFKNESISREQQPYVCSSFSIHNKRYI